jgi:SAM-dependent methyltransferase
MKEDIGRQIGDDREIQYYKRDFWSKENLKFARIHYRLAKAARIAIRIAGGRDSTLLDVGCGPAALTQVLPANIHYYGIDIAIQEPAENLLEADFLENPIKFGDKKFDIVLAQGVFEYMGEFQSQKFAEIARLLNAGGTFIVSYVNFGHRNREVYEPYSNVQSFADFRTSLARHFTIDRYFPTSHNWGHAEPNRRLVKSVNMHINANIPFISPALAVEYFFICSVHGSANAGA